MKEPNYTQVLKTSWKLAWEHKGLWPLGLFAVLLGQLGIVELLTKLGTVSVTFETGGFWAYLIFFLKPSTWTSMWQGLAGQPDKWLWLVWMLILLIGLAAALLFVAVVSQGALVHAAAKFSKRLSTFPDEAESWHVGVKHFWRVLFLNILRKLVFFFIALLVLWSSVKAAVSAGASDQLLFIVVFALAAIVGMVLSFLLIYAVAYVIVEEYGLGRSITAAWKLFTDHWLVSFELGFILIAANIAVIVAALAGFVYLFLLPIVLATYLNATFGWAALFNGALFIGYILFLLFAALLASVFTVFVTSVWTYLFVRMHKHGVKSHIAHLFRK